MQDLLDVRIPAVVLIPLLLGCLALWRCSQWLVHSSQVRSDEISGRSRQAREEQEWLERDYQLWYGRSTDEFHPQNDHRVEFRRQPVSGYDYPRGVQVEQDYYRYSDSSYNEYRRREDGDAMRRRAWPEGRREVETEELRSKREKEFAWTKLTVEEEERRRGVAADADVRARPDEEAEKTRIAAEEEVRRRREEDGRRIAATEEEGRRRQEEEFRRRQEEEEFRRRQGEEESRRRQAEEEDRQSRQAAVDESIKNAEAVAQAQAQKMAEEEEMRRRRAEEISQKGMQDDVERIVEGIVPPPWSMCVVCQKPKKKRCAKCKTVFYCSRACQVQHWHEGHKSECRTLQACSSPSSSEGGARGMVDLLSPKSSRSDVGSDETVAPLLSAAISRAPTYDPPTISHSAPASPLSGSLLKTSSTVSADGRRLKPKKVLFSYEDFVELFDCDIKFSPCGLFNCGNSCFANAVLQCLTYTQPLVAYLLRGDHGEYCKNSGWCFMCSLQQHAVKVKQSRSPFSPVDIVSQLRNIGSGLSYGKQEDAHEFMSYAIHLMQSICLDGVGGEKAVDDSTQETTLIHRTFGGLLQSQVSCMECGHESNIYENMMDLAVEIQGNVGSVEDALREFTAAEKLDGENKYKCDCCKAYVEARKQITIHEAPNILIVTLKRFKGGRFGKLNKRVAFSEVLDMTSYMSQDGDRPPGYSLYAVVVHVDMDDSNATYYGHYMCLVKDSNGCWYRLDDSQVTQVDIYTVTSQQAYMLLYKRSKCRPMDSSQNSNPHHHQQQRASSGYVPSSFSDHSQPHQFPLSMYPCSTRTDRTDTMHAPIGMVSSAVMDRAVSAT